jgi:hemoglobin
MSGGDELGLYERLGGDKVAAVVAGFYRRVAGDPILAPLYPEHDLAGAEERLRDFLIYRLGGPPDYLHKRGHPRLRMRHAPFAIDQAARDRWLELMQASMREQRLPAALADSLTAFLGDIATFLINRPGGSGRDPAQLG